MEMGETHTSCMIIACSAGLMFSASSTRCMMEGKSSGFGLGSGLWVGRRGMSCSQANCSSHASTKLFVHRGGPLTHVFYVSIVVLYEVRCGYIDA